MIFNTCKITNNINLILFFYVHFWLVAIHKKSLEQCSRLREKLT